MLWTDRRDAREHERDAVASQGMLEQLGEFRVLWRKDRSAMTWIHAGVIHKYKRIKPDQIPGKVCD